MIPWCIGIHISPGPVDGLCLYAARGGNGSLEDSIVYLISQIAVQKRRRKAKSLQTVAQWQESFLQTKCQTKGGNKPRAINKRSKFDSHIKEI